MRILNLAEMKIIGGGNPPAKTATGKRHCEVGVYFGVNEQQGAHAEFKVVFKFGR